MKNHRYLAKFRTESQEKNIKIIEAESYRAAYDQMCLVDGYKNFKYIRDLDDDTKYILTPDLISRGKYKK